MEINVKTKFDIGDFVWTGGWDMSDKEMNRIPVLCEVFWISVNAIPFMDGSECETVYHLIPVASEEFTLVFPFNHEYLPTESPEGVKDFGVFATREECAGSIKEELPF